jgi:hypothetical protein
MTDPTDTSELLAPALTSDADAGQRHDRPTKMAAPLT